jgi:hypothetical protein
VDAWCKQWLTDHPVYHVFNDNCQGSALGRAGSLGRVCCGVASFPHTVFPLPVPALSASQTLQRRTLCVT